MEQPGVLCFLVPKKNSLLVHITLQYNETSMLSAVWFFHIHLSPPPHLNMYGGVLLVLLQLKQTHHARLSVVCRFAYGIVSVISQPNPSSLSTRTHRLHYCGGLRYVSGWEGANNYASSEQVSYSISPSSRLRT